ncbi:MAG: ABC transporter ATP-binding protein [Candidatus Thermoplasmatota archaeon]|jgi:lipopolysaccharide transport system ATP-binding protein|nr:ABC transporter ATP-binding protein [Candidatus Thermoplasmatota archaeon]MDP7265254.1 ABC transporter ATP-binding protein [Candidatus Thermoplasmatota archaeon]
MKKQDISSSSNSNPVIVVSDLNISFRVPSEKTRTRFSFLRDNLLPVSFKTRELEALRDVSLEVEQGECVGIIGENGSGKSTLLKVIAGILRSDSGTVTTTGKISPFLELGVGFQGELSARENIFIFGAIMGIPKKRMGFLLPEIISFAGLERFSDVKIKNFSSGMYARLSFSCAVSVEPDILLIDEVFAVGDEAFRHKCINKLLKFKAEGRTIVVVSHRLGDIKVLCDRLILLTGGKVAAAGDPDDVISYYLDSFVSEDGQIRGNSDGTGAKPGKSQFPKKDGSSARAKGKMIKQVTIGRSSLKTGDDLVVDIEFETRQEIKEPHLIIQIFKTDGPLVFATNSARDSFSILELKGLGKIRISFPKIPLLTGDYYVNIELWGGRLVECIEKREACGRFSVISKSKDGTGIVKMEHRWEPLGRDET